MEAVEALIHVLEHLCGKLRTIMTDLGQTILQRDRFSERFISNLICSVLCCEAKAEVSGVAVTLLACSLEIPGSNLGYITCYAERCPILLFWKLSIVRVYYKLLLGN
jgi:hypothetical protein